jgi:proteasome lid subunit RPN8/RPN11
MQRPSAVAFVGLWLTACASTPSGPVEGRDYGYRNGDVWVRGPWEAITPSSDVDAVIDQLCPAVMRLPRAQGREYGQEYCGAIYSLGDGTYHASQPSTLGPILKATPEPAKSCFAPRAVDDARGRAVVLADYHSHPWSNSRMSSADRRQQRQRFSIRIQFDTQCRVMKLIPYAGEPRPGELYERREKRWVRIGIIKPEHKEAGTVTQLDE